MKRTFYNDMKTLEFLHEFANLVRNGYSISAMAEETGKSFATIQRFYNELIEAGFIDSICGERVFLNYGVKGCSIEKYVSEASRINGKPDPYHENEDDYGSDLPVYTYESLSRQEKDLYKMGLC